MMTARANWRAVCTAQACSIGAVAQMDVPVVGTAERDRSVGQRTYAFSTLAPGRAPMLIAGMNELKEAIAFAKAAESKWPRA